MYFLGWPIEGPVTTGDQVCGITQIILNLSLSMISALYFSFTEDSTQYIASNSPHLSGIGTSMLSSIRATCDD